MWFQVPKHFEGIDFQREELKYYLRWSRRGCYCLSFLICLNSIITVGLFAQPWKDYVHLSNWYSNNLRVPPLPSLDEYHHKPEMVTRASTVAEDKFTAVPAFGPELKFPITRDVAGEYHHKPRLIARGNTVAEDDLFPVPAFGPELKLPVTRDVAVHREHSLDARLDPATALATFKKYVYIGGQIYLVSDVAPKFFNIVKDCTSFNEESANSFNCVWAAIGTVIGFFTFVNHAIALRGALAATLTSNNWHIVGINRREITAIEDAFSQSFRTNVSHIGFWDGVNTGVIAGRNEPIPRHIFGATVNGLDMHFTYMGKRDNGTTNHFKIGMGPGPDTEKNRERLRGRDSYTYNNQYFSSGGLDFTGVTVEQDDPDIKTWMETSDPNEETWIVQAVGCYLSQFNLLTGSAMGSNGLYFQLFNSKDSETLSAGSVSPFTATQDSVIAQMPLKGGLPTRKECARL